MHLEFKFSARNNVPSPLHTHALYFSGNVQQHFFKKKKKCRQLYQEVYSLDVMTKLAKAGTEEEREEAVFNLRPMLQMFSCVPG